MKNLLLVGYKAFADIAGKGALFAVTVVAARRLTPHAFGIFAIASTVGWLMAVATDFGTELHLARSVSRAPDDAASLLATWLRVRAAMAAVAMALLWIAVAVWHPEPAVAVTMVFVAATYVMAGLIEFLHYFYRALGRSDIESSLILWQRSATLLFGLGALAWRPDLVVLSAALMVPVVITLAWSLRIATRITGTSGDTPNTVATRQVMTELRYDVLPIGAGIMLSALYFRVDVFLVQLWCGTDAVARYNGVFRLVEALRLFPAATLAVALPSLCRAANIRPLASVSAALTVFATMTTAILWASAGWLVPLVYGPAFTGAVPTFRILLLSFPLLSLNYALTHQLIGWQRQRAYAWLCGFALIVNLALNAQLIPMFAIDGAAWATLGTEIFLSIGCAVVLWGRSVVRHPSPVTATATPVQEG